MGRWLALALFDREWSGSDLGGDGGGGRSRVKPGMTAAAATSPKPCQRRTGGRRL
jgi:hypothetical protein